VEGQDVAALDKAGLIALRRRVGMIFPHCRLSWRAPRKTRSPDASRKSSR
jgi:ABC-type methionine transport system ATPase subunit